MYAGEPGRAGRDDPCDFEVSTDTVAVHPLLCPTQYTKAHCILTGCNPSTGSRPPSGVRAASCSAPFAAAQGLEPLLMQDV